MVLKSCKSGYKFLVLGALFAALAWPSGSALGQEKRGKNWKLKLNTLYVYDSNVVQAPTEASLRPANLKGRDDSIFEWSGTAAYIFKPTKKFNLTADYDIDMTLHSELSQYNLTSQMFGIKPVYKFTPLIHFSLQNFFIWNVVDDDNFSGVSYFSPTITHMSQKLGLTRISYSFKNTNNANNDLRDTEQHGAEITHYFFFSNYKRHIGIGGRIANDDATGRAFDRDIREIKIFGKTEVAWGIIADFKYRYSLREYQSRPASDGTADREDNQQFYSIKLEKILLENWKYLENLRASIKFSRTDNESNLNVREYKSNRWDLGLQARF